MTHLFRLLMILTVCVYTNAGAQAPLLKWVISNDSMRAASSITIDGDTSIWLTTQLRIFPNYPPFQKYTNQGVALPTSAPGPNSLIFEGDVDNAGNFYTYGGGGGPNDGCTVNPSTANMNYLTKHDPSGSCQWRYQFVFQATSNGSMVVDGNSVFAAGFAPPKSFGLSDFSPASANIDTLLAGQGGYLAKYSTTDFSLDWLQGVGGRLGYVNAIEAIDGYVYASGYFLETGYFGNAATLDSITGGGIARGFLAKYVQSNGNLEWVTSMPTSDVSAVNDLAVGANNVYVVGYYQDTIFFDPNGSAFLVSQTSSNSSTTFDVYVACYDKITGNYKWAQSLGSGDGIENAGAITIDEHENVYATGLMEETIIFSNSTTTITSNGLQDAFLVKYDSTGTFLWAGSIGGLENERGWDLAYRNGTLYVAGGFDDKADFDVTADTNFITARYPDNAFLAAYATDSLIIGIEDVVAASIGVYPNPANSMLTVKAENCLNCSWKLYDLVGKEQVQVSLLNNTTEVLLPNLANGLYLWTFIDQNGTHIRTGKIVIGH